MESITNLIPNVFNSPIMLYGLGAMVGIGGLFLLISKFLNKSKAKSKERGKLHNIFSKQKKKKIESIEREQVKVAAEMSESTNASAEAQKKVRDIVDKASEDINEVLAKENPNIVETHNAIKDDLQNL